MSELHEYCVILAGGAGVRFWPLSREDRPKQFLLSEKSGVQAAFSTLRPAVSGVIAVAAARIVILALLKGLDAAVPSDVSTWANIYIQAPSAVFYMLCLGVLFRTKIHPVFVVLAGGVFGVVFC